MVFETKIAVDYGDYLSCLSAATDEKNINWWDDEDERAVQCTQAFAAIELREHLCRIYDLDASDDKIFPIIRDDGSTDGDIILIGNSLTNRMTASTRAKSGTAIDYGIENLPDEGFIIKSVCSIEGKRLMLAGKDRVGTLYAVYDFLEQLGVRWYGLSAEEMVFTEPGHVSFWNIEKSEAPDFVTRGGYSEFIDDTEEDFIAWLTRNRVNFLSLDRVTDPHNLKKRGIKLCMGGHHLLNEYLNPDTVAEGTEQSYRQRHPEWYGLIDGERNFDMGDGAEEGYGHNYCTSNQEATRTFCANMIDSLACGDLMYADYLNLWLLDNGRWCQCDQCEATGNYSRRLIQVVYTLQKLLEDAENKGIIKRHIKILFPAYHETLPVPDSELPVDFDYDRCIVTYFPIERCYVHNISDPKCTETNQELMETLKPWSDSEVCHYKGRLLIGEYYNVSAFAACHIPLMTRMKYDLPFYYELGARHMHYMHMTDSNWGGLRLTNYQLMRMLWCHSLDADALVDAYMNDFYGNQAGVMAAFYHKLETAMSNAKALKHYQYHKGVRHQLAWKLANDEKELFPLKHLQLDQRYQDSNAGISLSETVATIGDCRLLIDRALRSTNNPVVRSRIMSDENRFAYTENMVNYLYFMVNVNRARWKGQGQLASRFLQRARVHAETLEKTKAVLKPTSRFDLFDNGLKASWCEPAYRHYSTMDKEGWKE